MPITPKRGALFHADSHALPGVLAMMIAGRFRFVVIEADRPMRGEGRVRIYRLAATHDEDDLPPDE
jgi:hypothetical protein